MMLNFTSLSWLAGMLRNLTGLFVYGTDPGMCPGRTHGAAVFGLADKKISSDISDISLKYCNLKNHMI